MKMNMTDNKAPFLMPGILVGSIVGLGITAWRLTTKSRCSVNNQGKVRCKPCEHGQNPSWD